MQKSGSGNHQADSGLASQIANGLGGITGGLFVAHSDVLQSGCLEGHGQLDNWDANDAEDILHTLQIKKKQKYDRELFKSSSLALIQIIYDII